MKETKKDRIVRAYQVNKSIRKVAALVKVSYGTVHNVLEERGVLLPWSGFTRVNRWRGGNRGAVARWIEHHQDVVLPPNTRDLARLTGLTIKDAHSWKVARWNKMKRLASLVVPKGIIKKMRYSKLEIDLLDGTILTATELFEMYRKLEERKGKRAR